MERGGREERASRRERIERIKERGGGRIGRIGKGESGIERENYVRKEGGRDCIWEKVKERLEEREKE